MYATQCYRVLGDVSSVSVFVTVKIAVTSHGTTQTDPGVPKEGGDEVKMVLSCLKKGSQSQDRWVFSCSRNGGDQFSTLNSGLTLNKKERGPIHKITR